MLKKSKSFIMVQRFIAAPELFTYIVLSTSKNTRQKLTVHLRYVYHELLKPVRLNTKTY